jgi:UDP-4-amino-4,6-dideoxy-N-acetyl-beta-L-altrosamine N-acetyltransferase
MEMVESGRVRQMTWQDLEQVLDWRNHESVRRCMYTQQTISLEDHTRWFEHASVDPKRHLLIFERDGAPAGFVNLNQTGSGGILEWGFYAAPQAPKGTGRLLGRAALHFAFTQAAAHKVCGQVVAYNHRSIRFHQHQGFTLEGSLRDQHFNDQQYHDVHCFGLLASEWQDQN